LVPRRHLGQRVVLLLRLHEAAVIP
jgi:putative transposon-encoded protein